ncbi:Serine/arginine repetitive matrix protein 2 [Apiospora arundinis]|uniref:Serine/arginine repetitive matrix protein 2 n=1 Tax=Apiospora arundinis TaxID=335852 RepID=A0ABR2IWM1_9PEZI
MREPIGSFQPSRRGEGRTAVSPDSTCGTYHRVLAWILAQGNSASYGPPFESQINRTRSAGARIKFWIGCSPPLNCSSSASAPARERPFRLGDIVTKGRKQRVREFKALKGDAARSRILVDSSGVLHSGEPILATSGFGGGTSTALRLGKPSKKTINQPDRSQFKLLDNTSGSQFKLLDNTSGSQFKPLIDASGSQFKLSDNTSGSQFKPLIDTSGSQFKLPDNTSRSQFKPLIDTSGSQFKLSDNTSGSQFKPLIDASGSQFKLSDNTSGSQFKPLIDASGSQFKLLDNTGGSYSTITLSASEIGPPSHDALNAGCVTRIPQQYPAAIPTTSRRDGRHFSAATERNTFYAGDLIGGRKATATMVRLFTYQGE